MKRVLITGGNGFIARNLYEQFKDEFEIDCPNRQQLDLLDCQKVLDYLRSKRFDVVIHAATYDAVPKHSGKDPSKVLEFNLKMFFNIARCKDYFGKMIFFGSGAEYSREHWIPKMSEDYYDKHVPNDQYGFSKYIMTKYALANENIYNLRLFAAFGKYEDWKVRLISSICHTAVKGEEIVISQNKNYDFMDICDLIRIVRWVIDNNPKHKTYNVCTGKTISFEAIAKMIVGLSGKNLKVRFEKEGEGVEYSGDNSLIMGELKDFKFTSIDESVRSLYGWYEENKEDI